MLKELLKNKRFREAIRGFLKTEGILDVILFGSVVRGKDEPNDIDLLVVYSSKVDNEKNYELRKNLEKEGLKVHVVAESYEKLFSSAFLSREGVLTEGYSLRNDSFVFASFGFSSMVFFRYYLRGKSDSDRMRFYYGLYGRGGEKGVLDSFGAVKFSDGVVTCPIEKVDDMRNFFRKWEIKFDEFSVLLPRRMSEKNILEIK